MKKEEREEGRKIVDKMVDALLKVGTSEENRTAAMVATKALTGNPDMLSPDTSDKVLTLLDTVFKEDITESSASIGVGTLSNLVLS